MKVIYTHFIILLLLVGGSSFAQTFITRVSAKTIGKKDVLQIEYVAQDGSLDQFVLPKFNTWNIISGPNFSSSTLQNGRMVKQETSYSVMLQPKATGKLIVPGATGLINDKPTRSNPVLIEAKNTDHISGNQTTSQTTPQGSLLDQLRIGEEYEDGQFLKKGENARDKIKDNILIKLDVSKQSCYVGEPILASYKLCTRIRSQSRVIKQPMFSGCTVIEMTGNEDPVARRERINGKSYNVYVIRRVQLFPLEEGKLTLPQASVENKVRFFTSDRINYRDLYYNAPSLPAEEQQITLQNTPVSINVKPLPAMPSVISSSFSGALGKFDIQVSADKKTLESNNTNQLLFTVIGEGNLQEVRPPKIKWPSGVEVFDPTEQDQMDKSHFPVMVRKTFAFPFVASKKGYYTIPAIEFTYFDPNANKYITKSTAPLMLKVAQGSKFKSPAFVKTGDAEGFQNRLYIILGAAFVAIIIGIVWYNEKYKVQPSPPGSKSADKNAAPTKESAIKQEAQLKGDTAPILLAIRELQPENNNSNFYKELCQKLKLYIQVKYNVSPSEVNLYVKERMKEDFTFDQLNTLLINCNLGMYTPIFAMEEAMGHRLLAIEILNKLEKADV